MRTWQEPTVRSPGGGAEYGEMIAALRDFLDDVAAAAPDAATTVALTNDLHRWAERLAQSAVPERHQIFARRLDLPGRGQTMSPSFIPITGDREKVAGTVTFGRYFLGCTKYPKCKGMSKVSPALQAQIDAAAPTPG